MKKFSELCNQAEDFLLFVKTSNSFEQERKFAKETTLHIKVFIFDALFL